LGNRLSKIYTRTGDDGSTGLGDGSRTAKDSLRVEAYGTVDELNSAVGVLRATDVSPEINDVLTEIQHRLFDLGGELCIPGTTIIEDKHVTLLENTLDQYNAELSPLKDFILPAGSTAGAACHMARAICRRAERRVCTLAASEQINQVALRYLNRLSDLLFVMARVINKTSGQAETLWKNANS
jgi:cob(I)alamin adenosyltransferase